MENGQLNARWDDGREPQSKHHRGQQTCNSHQPSKQMGQGTRQESRWRRHGPEENAHVCHGWECCVWSSTEEACTWHTNRSFIHPSARFWVDQVWGPPTSMEKACIVGQNGHFSLHHDQSGVRNHDHDDHPCHENDHHQNHGCRDHHHRDIQQQDCGLS